MPSPYEAVLLAVAAWRVWHLLAEDTLLDRPRRYITRLGDWQQEGDPVPDNHRFGLREFIECPYCLGFHVSLVIYLFWAWQHETIYVCIPFALNAAVVAMNHWLNRD